MQHDLYRYWLELSRDVDLVIGVRSMKKYFLTHVFCLFAVFALVACGTTGGTGGSRTADANGMYRVKSGDTLSLIARDNGVNYTDIMRWNHLTNPNVLHVGWYLRVRANAAGFSHTPRPTASKSVVSKPRPARVRKSSILGRDLSTNPTIINNNIVWMWPVTGSVLRKFDGAVSKGVVLAGNLNDDVLAASDGEVIYAGNGLRGYGNMVVINHNDTWSSVYAHNERILVAIGDRVSAGQAIAQMGSSDADRVQLYFEVRLNAKPIDPFKVLPAR